MLNPVFGSFEPSPGDIVFAWFPQLCKKGNVLAGLRVAGIQGNFKVMTPSLNRVVIPKNHNCVNFETPRTDDMLVLEFKGVNSGINDEVEYHSFKVDRVVWYQGAALVTLSHIGQINFTHAYEEVKVEQ